MSDLIRDAPVGQMIRWAFKGKYLQYPEEKDPSLWEQYVDKEKSKNMAQYGSTDPPDESDKEDNGRQKSNSDKSANTEKGKDVTVITWFDENDPENPQNWSQKKKHFVAFEICLLTTGIYIGSAIYSAGEEYIEETFGVSAVAATLGLTLFVAGYGLGKTTNH